MEITVVSPLAARRTWAARSGAAARIPIMCTRVSTFLRRDAAVVSHTSTMNFAFTEEQEELRKTVRAFLEAKSPETAVREQMETEDGFDPAVWSQMGEQMGLQGLHIPEEYGGSGYSYVELGIVLEEMGRALLSAPFFSSVVLAANTLLHSGDDAAKKTHLPGIASGETIATLAFTEPSGKWDEAGITMEATGTGGDYTLNGTKMFVLDGHAASLILVAARTGKGVSLFAVDGNSDGPHAGLAVDDGPDAQASQARVRQRLQPLWVLTVMAGRCCRRCSILPLSAWPPSRSAGRRRCWRWRSSTPRCVCSSVARSARSKRSSTSAPTCCWRSNSAKSAAYYGMWCAAKMNDELPSVASLSKAYCSEAYFHTTAENIQIHGGIGFTWEHPAHLFFKRAKSSELLFGDQTYHRELLAQRIGL